jgi:hypothetical protein
MISFVPKFTNESAAAWHPADEPANLTAQTTEAAAGPYLVTHRVACAYLLPSKLVLIA